MSIHSQLNSAVFMLDMKCRMPATAAVAFEAFTDPNRVAEWFGPKDYTVSSVEFTPRVGSRYRIEMQPPKGKHFFITGEVREADAPNHLAFTFVYEEPHADDVANHVSLSFLDLGEATETHLTHGPFRTPGRCALHRDGWSDSFDTLECLLSLASPPPKTRPFPSRRST